jgi:hypothetical protein
MFGNGGALKNGTKQMAALLILLQVYFEVAAGETAHMHGGSSAASVAAHHVGTGVSWPGMCTTYTTR